MSFETRQIAVTFRLGKGAFGEDGSDTVRLDGLRVAADISQSGGFSMGVLNLRMFGLDQSKMNLLSTMGLRGGTAKQNTVKVEAGTASRMTKVFEGSIFDAWADYNGAPDCAFVVSAGAGFVENVKPVDATSFKGGADVADVMRDLAGKMKLEFENNGVSVMLSDPYLQGSARAQVETAAAAADISFVIENGKLAIWPKHGSRSGEPIVVSPDTGLIGYPMFNSMGLIIETEFNPSIAQGSRIKVESSLQPANGIWRVNTIAHNLAAGMPGGPWFTSMEVTDLAVYQ